jgi:hypothetical protein
MNIQEKFQAAIQEIADERDLDLIVEHRYANSGSYSFQPRGGFEPVLRFPFDFQTGYPSFSSGAGQDRSDAAQRAVRGATSRAVSTRRFSPASSRSSTASRTGIGSLSCPTARPTGR